MSKVQTENATKAKINKSATILIKKDSFFETLKSIGGDHTIVNWSFVILCCFGFLPVILVFNLIPPNNPLVGLLNLLLAIFPFLFPIVLSVFIFSSICTLRVNNRLMSEIASSFIKYIRHEKTTLPTKETGSDIIDKGSFELIYDKDNKFYKVGFQVTRVDFMSQSREKKENNETNWCKFEKNLPEFVSIRVIEHKTDFIPETGEFESLGIDISDFKMKEIKYTLLVESKDSDTLRKGVNYCFNHCPTELNIKLINSEELMQRLID